MILRYRTNFCMQFEARRIVRDYVFQRSVTVRSNGSNTKIRNEFLRRIRLKRNMGVATRRPNYR